MKAETHPIEKEQVMAYLDGELSPEASAQVAAHLAGCSDCRALEAELREVSSEMLAWNVEPSPASLTHGMNAAIRAETFTDSTIRKPRFQSPAINLRRAMFSRWVWATACVVVMVMIFVKAFRPAAFPERMVEQGAELVSRSGSNPYSMLRPSPRVAAGGGGGGGRGNGMSASVEHDREVVMSLGADSATVSEPMIARTASVRVSVKDFEAARASVDRIVRAREGYTASMTINTQKGESQSLEAELHIPAPLCDVALADLKNLGRVEQEQQGGEEVTAQVVDLDARLKNARITETRLEEILRTRTGKVGDVLEVEREMASVREQIERMEGEQKALQNRVAFASIQLELHEEYAASLDVNSSSVGRRVRNALVNGFGAAADGVLSLGLFLLYVAPSLILLGLVLFWPLRWAWRRLRQA
jgi:anti-sigma factor RsiW